MALTSWPQPEQISCLFPRLRRTHSLRRLPCLSISARYSLNPGEPSTFVPSFSSSEKCTRTHRISKSPQNEAFIKFSRRAKKEPQLPRAKRGATTTSPRSGNANPREQLSSKSPRQEHSERASWLSGAYPCLSFPNSANSRIHAIPSPNQRGKMQPEISGLSATRGDGVNGRILSGAWSESA
jgi:hypothetical protein